MAVTAVVLLGCIVAGVWRAARGPTARDRLTAFVLLGTTGAALLIVIAALTDTPAFRDAAIAVVGLAAVVALVWTQRERQ